MSSSIVGLICNCGLGKLPIERISPEVFFMWLNRRKGRNKMKKQLPSDMTQKAYILKGKKQNQHSDSDLHFVLCWFFRTWNSSIVASHTFSVQGFFFVFWIEANKNKPNIMAINFNIHIFFGTNFRWHMECRGKSNIFENKKTQINPTQTFHLKIDDARACVCVCFIEKKL